MSLEPFYFKRVRVIDIDGTVIRKRDGEIWFNEPAEALPGAVARVNQWFDTGDLIIFCTARTGQYRLKTIEELDTLGFKYHYLIMDKPYSHEIYLYDDNPVYAIRVERNRGIGLIADPQEAPPQPE